MKLSKSQQQFNINDSRTTTITLNQLCKINQYDIEAKSTSTPQVAGDGKKKQEADRSGTEPLTLWENNIDTLHT